MNFPDDTQRLTVIGSTGSGKTQAALWHLSHRRFDQRPWLIYDFKLDDSIMNIPQLQTINLDQVPVEPGVYAVHPLPEEIDYVNAQMNAVWKKGSTGIMVDEGYMLGQQNWAFRRLLTQGRSKEIPLITLSQRPVWMDKFILSESEFFQVFRLQHRKDIRHVEEFIPHADLDQRLPAYHSWYYDSIENKLAVLRPVPSMDTIYRTFDLRLRRKVI